MYIFGCKFPPRGGGNSGFCSRTPSRRRRRGHVATFFNFRQHDRNASGEPPWPWGKTTARNAAAPPRLQRERAPLLRGRIPLKINVNLHGDRPAWETAKNAIGGHRRICCPRTTTLEAGTAKTAPNGRWKHVQRAHAGCRAGNHLHGRFQERGEGRVRRRNLARFCVRCTL